LEHPITNQNQGVGCSWRIVGYTEVIQLLKSSSRSTSGLPVNCPQSWPGPNRTFTTCP